MAKHKTLEAPPASSGSELSGKEILDSMPGGPPMLKGSDVPKQQNRVVIEVTAVRLPPKGFNSAVILDIKPVFEKESWAVNKTNLRALVDKYGDNLNRLAGKKIPLIIALVNNPKENRMVRSLFVEGVEFE